MPSNPGAGKPRNTTDPNHPVYIRERQLLVARLRLSGKSVADVASALNLSENTIKKISNQAADLGLVEEARKQIEHKLVPKIEKVYNDIFEAPVTELADKANQKGYEIKLKAARHVADGMGVFRRQTENSATVTKAMDLQAWLAQAAEPPVIDAEVSPPTLPSSEGEEQPLLLGLEDDK